MVLPAVLLAALVLFVILQPLRSRPETFAGEDRRADLEAAKESKYREIKDAELDFQMGKMSEEDYLKAFSDADSAYERMLTALVAELKK